jgi:hypothetical protein
VAVVLPTATLDATPWVFTVAMAAFVVFHVTEVVRFCVLPSEYVPVAVNAWVVPSANDGFDGVIAIEFRVAATTVRFVDPEMAPDVATIDVLPVAIPVASPVLLMVAMPVAEELQVALFVRFWVLPSV